MTGPVSEHCCPVFAKGTRLKNCYLRDSKLYVNLSADVLKADAYNTDFREQIDLLKKNISDVEFDSDASNNDRILKLSSLGFSNKDIAKYLNLGIGEVKLVVDLYKETK